MSMGDQRYYRYPYYLPKGPSNRPVDPHMRYSDVDNGLCFRAVDQMNSRIMYTPMGLNSIFYQLPIPVADFQNAVHVAQNPAECRYSAGPIQNCAPLANVEDIQEVRTYRKTPLQVYDPNTKSYIAFDSVEKEAVRQQKGPLIDFGADNTPTNNDTIKPEEEPIKLLEIEKEENDKIEFKIDCSADVSTPEALDDADEVGDDIIDNGDENDDDIDAYEGRIIYSRDSLLALKSASPQIDLEHYETIMKQTQAHLHGNYIQRRIIRLPATALVKKVTNAFIPSRLRTGDEKSDSLASFSQDINIILNRLSDVNLHDTLADLKKINITTSEQLKELAKLVFQKGIRQSKYCKVFANLSKELKSSLIAEINKKIDDKIAAAKDDSVKRMLEDDRESNILKQKESYFGNITFIGELFLCKAINVRIIIDCLKRLRDSSFPESLNSLIVLLNLCGSEMEESSKPLLNSCFARLEQAKNSDDIETHELYKLRELFELRAKGWRISDSQAQQSVSTNIARRVENKPVRSYMPSDTSKFSFLIFVFLERKPAHVNPVKPSSLAVTQQSHDLRKLGPNKLNWTQGSGQHLRPDDSSKINQMNSKAGNRSREGSLVPAGPQGAWLNRLSVIENSKKDYPSILESTASSGRMIIDMLVGNDETHEEVFREVAEDEICALLHNVYEHLMDKSTKLRDAFGQVCVDLLNKNVLKSRDMIDSFSHFFELCDNDWLLDYPRGWLYVAEILHHLVRNANYFPLLLKIVEPICSDGKASEVVAHCLRLSLAHVNSEQIIQMLKNVRFKWSTLGITGEANIKSIATKHSLEFTLNLDNGNVEDLDLNELVGLMKINSINEDGLHNYFMRLSSQGNVSESLIQSVMQVILQSLSHNRSKIDSVVISLGILIDHIPVREYQVLCSLQNLPPALVESWLLSLIEKKVISSETINLWKKNQKKTNGFSKMDEILSTNPVLNSL